MNELRLADIEVEDLKRHMEGRWLQALEALGNDALKQAVERWQNSASRKVHGECPVHGGENADAFRLFEQGAKHGGADITGGGICNSCGGFRDGFKLLQTVNGWDFKKVIFEVAKISGYNPQHVAPVRHVPQTPTKQELVRKRTDDDRKRWNMRKLHKESVPIGKLGDNETADLVRRYLKSRGIHCMPYQTDIRAHPGVYYLPEDGEPAEHAGKYPAMLAVVRAPDGTPVSLHRTWLTQEATKARVAQPRREIARPSYFSTIGAAIRLGKPGCVLGIAEGIETALAARQAVGIPVWSTLNAALMESVVVPESVRKVVIFADKDTSLGGQRAAAKLAERLILEARDVLVCLPESPIPNGKKGIDWNDVLVQEGPDGFAHLGMLKDWAGSARTLPLPDVASA